MGPLRAAFAALALLATAPAAASPIDHWQPLIAEASARFGIPEAWIARVMQAESAGHTVRGGRPITSHAGAMGLMQVMPGTYADLARTHGLGSDPHQPRDNILAGTAYLRAMYDRYGYPGLFAAYNAGPRRYDQHLREGRVLPAETRAYMAQLTPTTRGGAGRAGVAINPPSDVAERPRPSLFFVQKSIEPKAVSDVPSSSSRGLFVTLNTQPGGRN